MIRPAQYKPIRRFGSFEVNLDAGELCRDGIRVKLQEKPFQVLAALLERPGEVVSKEELEDRLWPDVNVDAEAGLGAAVYKLRQALDDNAGAPQYIETLARRGYRFVAAVEHKDRDSDAAEGWLRRSRLWKLIGIGAATAVMAPLILIDHEPATPLPQRRYSYQVERLTIDLWFNPVVEISPDGSKLAFGADGGIWVQRLDQLWAPRRLAGADGEGWPRPAWSPDSQRLAVLRDGEVRTVDVNSGRVRVLSNTPGPAASDIVWTADGGSLLLRNGQDDDYLYEVPADGGELRLASFQSLPRSPNFFPSRGRFGALGQMGTIYRPTIGVWLGPEQMTELCLGREARYASSGHVLFTYLLAPSGVWAVSFSAGTAEATGEPFPVAKGGSSPSVSHDGTLVYAIVPKNYDRLLLLDRTGKTIRRIGERQMHIGYPALSPDEKRVAVWGIEPPTREDWGVDIWIHEVDRPIKTRLTTHPGVDLLPRWTPDGKFVSFSSDRSNRRDLYLREVSASSAAKPLMQDGEYRQWIQDWSPNGRKALLNRQKGVGSGLFNMDLWLLDVESGRQTRLTDSTFHETTAAFSPDGRYLAFTSNRSGRYEIFACEVDTCGETLTKISTNGGEQVRWAKKQGSIYYVEGHSKMMEVRFESESEPKFGEPIELFESPYLWLQGANRLFFFDVTADGENFVVVEPSRAQTTKESPGVIHVWQNWAAAFVDQD